MQVTIVPSTKKDQQNRVALHKTRQRTCHSGHREEILELYRMNNRFFCSLLRLQYFIIFSTMTQEQINDMKGPRAQESFFDVANRQDKNSTG